MYYLSANNGPQAGKRYELRADRTVMGRHPDCQVVIDVGAVSRQHAAVAREGNEYYLEDLSSRNGTFLNEEPTKIEGRRLLKPGDVVRVCEVSFTLHSDSPMPFSPPPASSCIFSTPTGRTATMAPGMMPRWLAISTSMGSPSSDSVWGMKP